MKIKYFVYGLKSWKVQFDIIKQQDINIYGNSYIEIKKDENDIIISKNLLKPTEIIQEFTNNAFKEGNK